MSFNSAFFGKKSLGGKKLKGCCVKIRTGSYSNANVQQMAKFTNQEGRKKKQKLIPISIFLKCGFLVERNKLNLGVLGPKIGSPDGVGWGLGPRRAKMVQNTTTIGIFAFWGGQK